MNYTLQCIKHKNVSKQQLDIIIKIKSVAWDYSYDQQLKWINENISDDDVHCLLLENGNPVAYMNLIDTWINVDGKNFDMFGVGNVCSYKKGHGYGGILMHKINEFIELNKRIGLLLCRDQLIPFYSKYGWKTVDARQIEFSYPIDGIHVMNYNMNFTYNKLKYLNPLF